jgi:dTMP kinase
MFIVLEGPDGSGTTTHAAMLAEKLQGQGKKILLTAEPSSGPIGLGIRESLKRGGLSPEALQTLFVEDRAWHLENEILPALRGGKVVICDRYISSTFAYGEALGLEKEWLRSANASFRRPDVLIFLLPPVDICWQRMGVRANKDTLETRELQEAVHAAYHRNAKEEKAIVIDSAGGIEEVGQVIERAVML